MDDQLIYIFDDIDTAERARKELIEWGFEAAGVTLEARDDEAGPVQGNFTVDVNPQEAGGTDDQHAFTSPNRRSLSMLTITTTNRKQSEYAVALLARYGVTDARPPVTQ